MADEVVETPVAEITEQPKEAPKPEAEVRAQDAEQPELPLAADPEVAAEPEPEASAAEATPEPTEQEKKDWRDREIARKHAQLQEAKRRIADLEAIATSAVADPEKPAAPAIPQDAVQKAAQALRAQEKFQENLVATNTAGEKAYGKDWNAAIDNLATLGEVGMETLSGILATDDPAKVLYTLGKNPSEYHRIMDIPDPLRRQTEFAKLSIKPAASKPSNAPAPTEPVKSRVVPTVEMSDKMTDEQWYAERQKMRAERLKKRA